MRALSYFLPQFRRLLWPLGLSLLLSVISPPITITWPSRVFTTLSVSLTLLTANGTRTLEVGSAIGFHDR